MQLTRVASRPTRNPMSVAHALLALLSEGPKYGLQLRQEFEARTGEVWPLNVGQVYTTLQRLERDGLVESDEAGEDGPQKDFRITPEGEEELAGWLRTPPDLSSPPRDELVIKVLVAARMPGVDVHEVIQVHRRYLVQLMQQWTRLKEYAADAISGSLLVVDAELFRLDSVVRWLDAADRPHPARRPDPAPHRHRTCRPKRARRVGSGDDRARAAEVSKLYGEDRPRSTRCATSTCGSTRRAGGGHGTERVGQEHPADHRRHARGADGGDVLVAGTAVAEMSRNDRARLRRRSIGFVFQDFNLLAGLTAAENVSLPLELDGTGQGGAARGDGGPRGARPRPTVPIASPTSCPAANASGWRSPGPSSASASCCSPTSRPARSTRPTARPSCA